VSGNECHAEQNNPKTRDKGMGKRSTMEKTGNYELFETTRGHRILSLNNKEWFAVVKGQKGDILVGSDADHEKSRTIKKGKFYLIDFHDDPSFKDMPHLFLQEGDIYREWMLPKGTPQGKGEKEKLVKTKEEVPKQKVERRAR